MNIETIELNLKGFRHHLDQYNDCYDRLLLIAEEIKGEPSSPNIKSKDQAFYQSYHPSTGNHRNNELIEDEQKLIEEMIHHRYAVHEVMRYLVLLNDDEVKLLEQKYWYGKTNLAIAKTNNIDESIVSRNVTKIKMKLHEHASKITI